MNVYIKQTIKALLFLGVFVTTHAVASPLICALGEECDLQLETVAVFPITDSGTYVCKVEYIGTTTALQDHQAIVKPGKHTQFTTAMLDIEGDTKTIIHAIVNNRHQGQLVIESSVHTLYYGAKAECHKI